MIRVTQDGDVFEIRSHMRAGQRVMYFVLALVPMLAPYELIIRPDWTRYWHPAFVFAAVVSGGALVVSGLLVWAAIAGLNRTMRFDRARGTLTCGEGAPVIRWSSSEYPVNEIESLEVETHDWTDGLPSYSFRARMADGRTFSGGSSWVRDEIEEIVERASVFLGREIEV